MTLTDKIGVLADAAKYDASCSTSGSARENSSGGIGTGAVGGICHTWSADGRCVALLKVLLSNVCSYDCAYCANRRSNDVARTSLEPDELVKLIVDFYKRNYIEGAFLSSGVLGCPDATMERLIYVARTLRIRERYNGYIHLKVIPGASDDLVLEAAKWADRVSVNIELPSAESLARIAPDKTPRAIFGPMRTLARASGFEPAALPDAPRRPLLPDPSSGAIVPADRAPKSVREARKNRPRNPGSNLLPAGQTTQLVVGASPESDATILALAENLYLAYDVRRVYYSAFIPTGSDPRLPVVQKPPLAREHRLYQADWLFRFYGFAASEILDPSKPFLDSRLDPKSAWAIRNLEKFPIDISAASYEQLLRIPGIGPRSAQKILRARKAGGLSLRSLSALGVVMRRAKWFITSQGKLPAFDGIESARYPGGLTGFRGRLMENPEFLSRELADPAFREVDATQPELPWESAT